MKRLPLRRRRRVAVALACALVTLAALSGAPAAAAGAAAAETWQSTLDPARTWRWNAASLEGPDDHRCRRPRHELRRLEPVETPAAVPGAPPRDAEARLRALGLHLRPVPTQRIACDGLALALLHGADGRAAIAGPGGLLEPVRRTGADDGPLAAVHELLRAHTGTPMGHAAERVRHVERWITRELRDRLLRQLARPRRGTVPAVPFDPWIGADEIPDRLWLEPAAVAGDGALVPVHAELGGSGRADHRITYALRRSGGRWLVDDIRYLDGDVTLRELLAR